MSAKHATRARKLSENDRLKAEIVRLEAAIAEMNERLIERTQGFLRVAAKERGAKA